MKTRLLLAVCCAALVLGCNQSKEEDLQKQVAQAQSDRESLQNDIAAREEYVEEVMNAVNEVYTDLEKARAEEAKIVKRSDASEGPLEFRNADARNNVLQRITDIGTGLKESHKRIADLQKKMKGVRGEMAGLNKLVENLKLSLAEREQSIAVLETRVQGLETIVTEKTQAIADKESMINNQQQKMNTAFYVVGTREELEEKGIITEEGGFLWGLLGSTTVMASGIDPSVFTPIDRTKAETIAVSGEIDEILPHRNEEFFAKAEPVDQNSSLTIVSPAQFWQDDYLVIVVD